VHHIRATTAEEARQIDRFPQGDSYERTPPDPLESPRKGRIDGEEGDVIPFGAKLPGQNPCLKRLATWTLETGRDQSDPWKPHAPTPASARS